MGEQCEKCRRIMRIGQGLILVDGMNLCMACNLKYERMVDRKKEERKPRGLIEGLLALIGF